MADEPSASDKARVLDDLKQRLRVLPGGGRHGLLPLGVAEIDAALGGGLRRGGLHEITAGDEGAATGFCAALAGRLAGAGARPVLWGLASGGLYAPGLHAPGLLAFGLDPTRLIVAELRRASDLLWAMEEGLRCRALAAVVAEVDAVDLTASRRLQLAAEESGVAGLLLRRGALDGRRTATAAVTRWHVESAASGLTASPNPLPQGEGAFPTALKSPLPLREGVRGRGSLEGAGREAAARAIVGPARWRLELLRCRGGRTGCWLVEWSHETRGFALAAVLRDGPAEPHPRQPRRNPAPGGHGGIHRAGARGLAPLGAV
jgi:protein ImuA